MSKIIKKFADNSYLEFGKGSFDNWCVYLVKENGKRIAPTDAEYFTALKDYANIYGASKVYNDFVQVYELTGDEVNRFALDTITEIAESYDKDALTVEKVLSTLYMAMIAEEKRENTRLGKRIKRLGIHVLLIEDESVDTAANFMRGMGWREIDALCKTRGF